MLNSDIVYVARKPDGQLSDFIESFWMLSNNTDEDKPIVLVPDGRIDLAFSFTKPYELTLLGLESHPSQTVLTAREVIFAISFKLLALEYLFDKKFHILIDTAYSLPAAYFGVALEELSDFNQFCDQFTTKLTLVFDRKIDVRKKKLVELLYASKGAITIKELAGQVNWSARQINRYFNQQFGLSVKSYCTILRFRASFEQIKEGKFYPEQDFADQAHFIKDVKRFSGVTPKELNRNIDDRFIQFSTLPEK